MNSRLAGLGRGHLGLRGLDAVRGRMLLFSTSDNGFHSVKSFWHYVPAPGLNARGDAACGAQSTTIGSSSNGPSPRLSLTAQQSATSHASRDVGCHEAHSA